MNILKWILIGFFSFVVMVGLVLGVMIYFGPKKTTPLKGKHAQSAALKKEKGKNLTAKERLLIELEQYKVKTDSMKNRLDSLSTLSRKQQNKLQAQADEIQKLTIRLKGKASKAARAKDLAKTLASMKLKSLAPILNKLDDQTVIELYRQMNRAARKNILLGLSDKRAAKITQKLINP